MRITHFNNSFLKIESPEACLICDPWTGMANEGGWQSFPEFDAQDLKACLANADAVYISHIHADHFDPAFLKTMNLLDKTFFIKDFTNKTLYRRLKSLGVETIHELPAFSVFTFKDMKLSIVPQMTSNSAALEDDIDYDMDTSIIVHADKQTFFNQVDNPLSPENYTTIKTFINKTFGDLDIACLVTGAASGYPQSYFTCDRPVRQQVIIDRCLEKFSEVIDILRPRLYFPAGGTYLIPGRFHSLNRYVAQPDYATLVRTLNHRATVFDLEGGRCLEVDTLSVSEVLSPQETNKAKAILDHSHDAYPHDHFDDSQISDADLEALFARAYANYSRKMATDGVTLVQFVSFQVYDQLDLDQDANIISVPRGAYHFTDHATHEGSLVFHMDRKLFIKCLTRAANWNQALALSMVERVPDVFHPTVDFSINYLIV